MTYYTYSHATSDGRVFYIGKGRGNRVRQSAGRAKHWQEMVAQQRSYESRILARWDTEDEALDHEVFLIKCFKDLGHPLVNRTTGGQRGLHAPITTATRTRMREAQQRINARCQTDSAWAQRIQENRSRAGSSPKPTDLHQRAAQTFRARFASDAEFAEQVRNNRRRARQRAQQELHRANETRVRKVRVLRAQGLRYTEIQQATGFSVPMISMILNGKMYKGVGE